MFRSSPFQKVSDKMDFTIKFSLLLYVGQHMAKLISTFLVDMTFFMRNQAFQIAPMLCTQGALQLDKVLLKEKMFLEILLTHLKQIMQETLDQTLPVPTLILVHGKIVQLFLHIQTLQQICLQRKTTNPFYCFGLHLMLVMWYNTGFIIAMIRLALH